jgi:hypothetical protein
MNSSPVASASLRNAAGNQCRMMRSALASHVASVPRASTTIRPPERTIICTRENRHARPTFSTPSAGQ